MSKPRFGWWGYAKNMVYRYPALADEHAESVRQKVTPSYSGQPGGGEASRTTENVAVSAMSANHNREYEAVKLAIHETELSTDGGEKMQLIRLMYWKRSHTLEGAAQAVHVSYRTGKRWHREFILAVGKNYGFLD